MAFWLNIQTLGCFYHLAPESFETCHPEHGVSVVLILFSCTVVYWLVQGMWHCDS